MDYMLFASLIKSFFLTKELRLKEINVFKTKNNGICHNRFLDSSGSNPLRGYPQRQRFGPYLGPSNDTLR